MSSQVVERTDFTHAQNDILQTGQI